MGAKSRKRRKTGLRSGVIVWVDSKFFHPRNEGGPAQTHAGCSSLRTSNTPLAVGQNPNDLVLLLPCVFVQGPGGLVIQGCNGLLDDACNLNFRLRTRILCRFVTDYFVK